MNNKKERFSRSGWTVLLLFGLIGQIAWSVENMYFNLFVFDTVAPNLNAITLMVQLSGITATVATLIAGTVSDKLGTRRLFISVGYIVWGVSVAVFGFLSPELVGRLFGVAGERAIFCSLALIVTADCIMTLFGSTANDAAFNAWVTDNTKKAYRGRVEGVLSILPLVSMLIVVGGFGMLVEMIGYSALFLILGLLISASGVLGIFLIKDSPSLSPSGWLSDIFFGFKISTVRKNPTLYLILLITMVYGVACQIFMPYLVIYMKSYLGFEVLEYSVVFGLAILAGAGINLYLTRLSDRREKTTLIYIAVGVFAAGLLGMYFSKDMGKTATIILFGIFGLVMITGYIFISALSGSLLRDYTPKGEVGKLQGVRMVFCVLIPMLLGPAVGNGINSLRGIPLADSSSADVMTTSYIPAPEIFLAAALFSLLALGLVPFVRRTRARSDS